MEPTCPECGSTDIDLGIGGWECQECGAKIDEGDILDALED